MPNLNDCIQAAQATGDLSAVEAEQIRAMVRNKLAGASDNLPDEMAIRQAEKQAMDEYFNEKQVQSRQAFLQVDAMKKNLARINSHPEGPMTGITALLVNDITRQAKYNNVDAYSQVLIGRFRAQLGEMMAEFRPKNAGFSQDKEGPRRVLLEAMGTDTGDPDAKRFAEMWLRAAEDARQMFNAMGGSIKKRKDWGMKQQHDATRIGSVSYEKWRDDITPLLDWDQMTAQTLAGLRAEIQAEVVKLAPATEKLNAATKKLDEAKKAHDAKVKKLEERNRKTELDAHHAVERTRANFRAKQAELADRQRITEEHKRKISAARVQGKDATQVSVLQSRYDASRLKQVDIERQMDEWQINLNKKKAELKRLRQKHHNKEVEMVKRGIGYTAEGRALMERIERVQDEYDAKAATLKELERRHKNLATKQDLGEVEGELKATYERIVTDGLSDREGPTGFVNQSKMANRHQQQRELVFKDGENYLKYHDLYGKGEIYESMIGHLDNMANEIAMMEILGPNPQLQFSNLIEEAKLKEYQKTGNVPSASKEHWLNNLFAVVSGETRAPVSNRIANFMSGTRSLLSAAKLGSATISALSDLAMTRMISELNGVPAMKVFNQALKQFNPANEADRIAAARMGLMADNWVGTAQHAQRFAEISGAEQAGATNRGWKSMGTYSMQRYADGMAKISDITMRMSLLSPQTQSMRNAFGMEFMGTLADHKLDGFDELPTNLRRAMQDYAISADDWDKIRQVDVTELDGAPYLVPFDLLKTNIGSAVERNRLIAKFQRMILQETNYAVPTPDARTTAMMTGSSRKGTFSGELRRGVTMFKSFPVTMISTHLYRMAYQQTGMDKLKYAANLFVGMTIMGAVAYQAKEIVKGRTPLDMTTRKFWAAAMAQGGGLGIIGDFFFADYNRYGGGLGETVGGPTVSLFDDALKITVGNVQKLAAGQDTQLGLQLLQAAKAYTPGSSLWYGRLVMERAIWDQIQKEVDPKAEQKFNRMIRKRKKDFDQQYWWRPQ